MISGIVPLLNPGERDIPYLLAIESWANVVDEMIVVTDIELGPLKSEKEKFFAEVVNAAKGKCDVVPRGIIRPWEHNVFRFFGYFFTRKPDWVVHFDGDYLISEEEGKKLRDQINETPEDVDCLTYELVYLNYDATALFVNPDFARWFEPKSGYSVFFPFVVNPRRGNFLCPFEGHTNDGRYVNFEGIVNLGSRWGLSYFTKYGIVTPHFKVIQTGVQVEHLSWSMALEFLEKKLQHEFWVKERIGIREVMDGNYGYGVTYPILQKATEKYGKIRKEWERDVNR